MKNKFFLTAIGCMLAIGLLAVCSANAEMMLVAESGFNSSASGIQDPTPLTTGALDGQGGTGLGWETPWDVYTGAGSVTVQTATKKEGDQAVKNVGAGCSYAREFTQQTSGLVLIEYAVNVGDFGMETSFYCGQRLSTTWGGGSVSSLGAVQVDNSSIDVQSGAGWTTNVWGSGTIKANTWHTIGQLYDLDNDTFTVFLDGQPDANETTFNAITTGLNLDCTLWYGGIDVLYIDEVTISAIPEPSMFVLLCLGMVGVMVGRCRRR